MKFFPLWFRTAKENEGYFHVWGFTNKGKYIRHCWQNRVRTIVKDDKFQLQNNVAEDLFSRITISGKDFWCEIIFSHKIGFP